jgi:hypothetical protein
MRWAALVAAGSLLVHELRYALEYGSETGHVLAYQGHSYLPFAEALVAVLWVSAFLGFVLSLVRAGRDGSLAPIPSLQTLWASASAALIAVYTVQEAIEGAVSAGHPGGLIGIYGNGGWTALVIATAVGALVALLVRGSQRALVLVAERRRAVGLRRRPERGRWPASSSSVPPRRPRIIAANLAGRAPPAAA